MYIHTNQPTNLLFFNSSLAVGSKLRGSRDICCYCTTRQFQEAIVAIEVVSQAIEVLVQGMYSRFVPIIITILTNSDNIFRFT
jgi:hypothetical protein